MERCEAYGNTNSQPARPAAVNAPGWFGSGTVFDYGMANAIMEAICQTIEGQGLSLDRTDDGQLYQAIVAGLESGTAGIFGITTLHDQAALVTTNCSVEGTKSLATASRALSVTGDFSAGIACDLDGVSSAPGIIGDGCFAAACDDLLDVFDIGGLFSAAIACQDPVVTALYGIMLASVNSSQTQNMGAVIASEASKNRSNINSVLMASKHCDSADSTVPPAYSVFGGYHPTTAIEPSWRIESQNGNIQGKGTVGTGGLDYAEFLDNADGVEHGPGRLMARKGRGARLCQPGDRLLGWVSTNPSVVGGADELGWRGKWLRDEFDRLIHEDVTIEEDVFEDGALQAHSKNVTFFDGAVRKAEREVAVKTRQAAHWAEALQGKLTALQKKRATEMAAKTQAELLKAQATLAEAKESREALAPPTPTKVTKTVAATILNPKYDAAKGHTPRSRRKEEKTLVGLIGQGRITVDETVEEGDDVIAGKDGLGTKWDGPYFEPKSRPGFDGSRRGALVECMEIVEPFDKGKGYAVALCFVR